jgi:hypothetical protein
MQTNEGITMPKQVSLLVVTVLFAILSACGGGGGESPVVASGDDIDPDPVQPPSKIELSHYQFSSDSDTQIGDGVTEINTTWNEGSFQVEFSAEAYDRNSAYTGYDYRLYLSTDADLNIQSDFLVRSGYCDNNRIDTGYECATIEPVYCAIKPVESTYVAVCHNRLGLDERAYFLTDLFTQFPEDLYLIFQVCHINHDNTPPVQNCVTRMTAITVY